MLLTRTPLYLPDCSGFLVRLACVKRAASVDSEPGSNSRLIFCFCGQPLAKPSGPSAYLLKISDELLLTLLPTRLSMIYATEQPVPFRKSRPLPASKAVLKRVALSPVSTRDAIPAIKKFGISLELQMNTARNVSKAF